MESNLIEHIEKELNPEYMNDVFTWKQIKDALESLASPTNKESAEEGFEAYCEDSGILRGETIFTYANMIGFAKSYASSNKELQSNVPTGEGKSTFELLDFSALSGKETPKESEVAGKSACCTAMVFIEGDEIKIQVCDACGNPCAIA